MEKKKELACICRLSKEAFNLASLIFGWKDVVGVTLGFGAEVLSLEKNSELEDIFIRTIEKTFNDILEEKPDDTIKSIIEELKISIPNPDTLEECIKKTDEYRIKYATNKNAIYIVEKFNIYFRMNVSKDERLSHYYMLIGQEDTLEQLKNIERYLFDSKDLATQMSKNISIINNIFVAIFNICILSFVSIACCLISCIITGTHAEEYMICVVVFSYFISSFFIEIAPVDQSIIYEIFSEKFLILRAIPKAVVGGMLSAFMCLLFYFVTGKGELEILLNEQIGYYAGIFLIAFYRKKIFSN